MVNVLPILAASFLGCTALATEPPVAQLAPTPRVIQVNAFGPPAQTCRQALGLGNPEPSSGKPNKPYIPPKANTEAMIQVTVGGQAADPASLPGALPDQLPHRALEGKTADLAHVRRVMAKIRAGGHVRLSFWGASHTSADWWTGQIRRTLQAEFGDQGHGFILPAALYKHYRGADINLCRSNGWKSWWAGRWPDPGAMNLGFGGMAVTSNNPDDFGWLQTTVSNPQGRRVSRYDIYTLRSPEGGTLLARVDEATPVSVPTLGPGPKLQVTRLEVTDGPHRLELRPKGDGEVRIFGVSAEREGSGVIIDTIGIRGKEARSWLQWDRTLATQGMAALGSDMVVLAYGTNEANDPSYDMDRYTADLRSVLGILREGLPDAACVLVGPTDRAKKLGENSYAIWDRTVDVAQVQRQVAHEFGCVMWDWQAATGGPGSMVAWMHRQPAYASKDGIHLTRAGYEWSAQRFLDALWETATAQQ
jgi:lysophospholipase L1-like esterase